MTNIIKYKNTKNDLSHKFKLKGSLFQRNVLFGLGKQPVFEVEKN